MTPHQPAIIHDTELAYPGFLLFLASELAHNPATNYSAERLSQAFLDKLDDDTDEHAALIENARTEETKAKAKEVSTRLWGEDTHLEDSEVIALHMLAEIALTPGLHSALHYYLNAPRTVADALRTGLALLWLEHSFPSFPVCDDPKDPLTVDAIAAVVAAMTETEKDVIRVMNDLTTLVEYSLLTHS